MSGASHGGYGSSSLQECLDRLNQARTDTPAPCHSRVVTEETSNPPQVMSPNMEEEPIHDHEQAHDTLPEDQLLPKDESQSRVKKETEDEEVTPKSESAAAAELKEEVDDQNFEDLNEELRRRIDEFPPPDSEDSLGPERVADELRRLAAEFPLVVDAVPQREPREGATAPRALRNNNGPHAPRRSRRHRGRPVSPDPLMFHTTIWIEHDQEASAHEEPIEQLRGQLSTMQANLETQRTRVGQIADLRDAQGPREGQRALTARLTEIEECTSVQTLREFMHRILRLEALVCGNHGGTIGEAIRACDMRLDNHKATIDDFYARIRTQEWYHDLSEQESEEEMQESVARSEGHDANAENQPGIENRPPGRHRIRNHAPQRRVQRQNLRPPQASRPQDETALTNEAIQQGIQGLYASYSQCVTRVAQADDRFEQFRAAIRRVKICNIRDRA